MKLIKDTIQNKIQLAAEVNGALVDYSLVIVTKTKQGEANPVYAIYACRGLLIDGEVHEFGDHDRDTREEEGQH